MKIYKIIITIFILILITGCSTEDSEDELDTSNSVWKSGKIGISNYVENENGTYTIQMRNARINGILIQEFYLYEEESLKNNILSEEIEIRPNEKLNINFNLDVCDEPGLKELSVQINFMDIETAIREVYTGMGNKYYINCEEKE